MRDTIALLRYEATRKPLVAALVERAADLTEAEIDNAPVLKWIRGALRDLRARARQQQGVALTLAALEGHIIDWRVPDSPGMTHRWTGPDMFLPFGHRSELL